MLEIVLTTLWLFSTENAGIVQFKTLVKTSGLAKKKTWDRLHFISSIWEQGEKIGVKNTTGTYLGFRTSSHALALGKTS